MKYYLLYLLINFSDGQLIETTSAPSVFTLDECEQVAQQAQQRMQEIDKYGSIITDCLLVKDPLGELS